MLEAAKGLVLKQTKYSETSLIVSIFTFEHGKRSYIIGSVRGAKKNKTMQYFTPGSYVQFTAFEHRRSNLHRIKEIEFVQVFHSVLESVQKSAVVMFMVEMLSKILKENFTDHDLFNLLISFFELLDTENKRTHYMLYLFLVRLAKYQGFYPHGKYSVETPVFDLQGGTFRADFPIHNQYVQGENAEHLSNLFVMNIEEFEQLSLGSAARLELLDSLLAFYKLHFEGVANLKSFEVLKKIYF